MESTSLPAGRLLPGWLAALVGLIITAALPLVLILINARLLMSPLFMTWEYNRPGFPPDPFGMTREDRLLYGPLGLAYLFNDEDIHFLGDLTFPDGAPVFNERELSHMYDVKLVTQRLVRSGLALLAVVIFCVGLLAASPGNHAALARSLLGGGILTVALLVGGIAAVALAFDWLFTQFHLLFFQGDTWIFPTSDTLIRLYPERFWIDAFALLFGGALVEAILIAALSWRELRRR